MKKRPFYSDSPQVQAAEAAKSLHEARRKAEREEWLHNRAICDAEAAQPWHADYVATCRANIQAILAHKLTPQEAATAILRRFPALSPSALTAWAKIADRPSQEPTNAS